MTDPFGVARRKVSRRKRRYQGASWTPPSMSADLDDGCWCRRCKQRHGYQSMGLKYEKNSHGEWMLIWSCPRTHDVIGQTELRRTDAEATERPRGTEPPAAD